MIKQRIEALAIFQDVLSCLMSSSIDLKTIIRKTYFASQTIGWLDQSNWLEKELNGYSPDDEIPSYRIITGKYEWWAIDCEQDRITWVVHTKFHPYKFTNKVVEPIRKITSNYDWIIENSSIGLLIPTKEINKVYISFKNKEINITKCEMYHAFLFKRLLQALESKLFSFVSNAVTLIKYGNLINDFFEKYQNEVEKKLIELGFEDRLNGIKQMLQTNNPELWRDSGLACRTLLHDIASYLWKDPRDYYENLPGNNKTEKLKVTEDMFANRLEAYLHQKKGFHEKLEEYIRSEIKYLTELIRKLKDLQATAKNELLSSEVISIVVATYFVIGELVQKTDMNPITKYVT